MARRFFGRTRGAVSIALALCRVPFWLLTKPGSFSARTQEKAFFAQICKGFGIVVETRGNMNCEPGTLYIMNHISWADIPVMMKTIDADFIAKSDMLAWPVLGGLARRFNPVFVARNEQLRVQSQIEAVRARLKDGRSVILCAEGTTSIGTSILPFRASLFAAANTARVVQPVVLAYLSSNGHALSAARQRAVAWIDNDALLSSAMRLAYARTVAQVEFLPPVAADGSRKTLADTVRHLMLDAYAAAPKR
jgi:lyso-ornithine lipid O-acyltransferase